MKVSTLGAEFFRANGRTDGQIDMKKRKITFGNFINAPKTIYKFLGNMKINGKQGRHLREEMIL